MGRILTNLMEFFILNKQKIQNSTAFPVFAVLTVELKK